LFQSLFGAARASESCSKSRSEGSTVKVSRLVELGPKTKTAVRPVSKPGRRLRAQELATKEIKKIIDPSAPPEERAQRRRRLTKGPPEFREVRVDLPKKEK
jgi:hypothetical protein